MRRIGNSRTIGCAIVLGIILLSGSASRADVKAPPDPQAVDAAIKKGIDYLESVEVRGSWDDNPQPADFANQAASGAYTALATYALLAAGEKPADKHMVDAIGRLEQIGPQMQSVYGLGMRCQVWAILHDKKLQPYIVADATTLVDAAKHNDIHGLFHYKPSDTTSDMSVSQYGVLGLWGCADCGLEIPETTWKDIEDAWIAKQYSDGSWGYQPSAKQNPGAANDFVAGNTTLTAAGIASLFVTQQYLHGNDGVKCTGNINNPAIDLGMDWLAQRASDLHRFPAYTRYAYERIGVASGYKYFGTYNWYAQGATDMLKTQAADGSWNAGLGQIADTSLSLLFLVRGRGPVILNKLSYANELNGKPDKDTRWNQRPRDVANATRWMGKELETDLNWQLVTLDTPVEELHDAPILYIAGSQAISLTEAQEDKLRAFVEEGGVILGNADCGKAQFVDGFKKLGHRLFPDYEFAQLKKDSPVFTTPGLLKEHHDVWEQNNGVRPLLILLGDDPAMHWQIQASGTRAGDFQLLQNILLYVQDAKHLMYKGESFIVAADPAVVAARRLKVARVQYAGNWNPEPGGWRRFAAILHNTRKTDLQVDTIKLGDGKLDTHYALADFTGTIAFKLSDAERAELKKYIDAGGSVVFDAAGASAAFADSAQAEIAALYPEAKLKLLPSAHPILQNGGTPIEAVYREAARKLIHGHTVRLSGVEINGRAAVFFSSEDMASALVGQPLSNIIGYDPATATTLMGNILDYASGAHVAPTTVPTSAATTR